MSNDYGAAAVGVVTGEATSTAIATAATAAVWVAG